MKIKTLNTLLMSMNIATIREIAMMAVSVFHNCRADYSY